MKVAFRADASLDIGSGHVMRCLTLADELLERGANCIFLCRDFKGHLYDLIESRGHQLVRLVKPSQCSEFLSQGIPPDRLMNVIYSEWLGVTEAEDAEEVARFLRVNPMIWMVVDHYALGVRWERLIRPFCKGILAIDDLANRPHDCDVLLDQNLGRLAIDYDGFVPRHCRKLIGPNYALLRPEFAEMRADSMARRAVGQCRHILVTMGGVDKGNVTSTVLTSLELAQLPADFRVTAVLGASAPWKEEVQAQAQSMGLKTRIFVNALNMAILMRDADLAIGAAGSTSWERCCMGLPTLQVVLAENQRPIAKALDLFGAAISIDRSSLLEAAGATCISLVEKSEQLSAMSAAAANVTDGCGAARVAETLFHGAAQ